MRGNLWDVDRAGQNGPRPAIAIALGAASLSRDPLERVTIPP
jgi:hypothetical protein